MTPAVSVTQLHKHYGNVRALDGLSLDIERGQVFGLLGANGAGKTTLIKSLIGLTQPDSGTIHVLDLNPHSQKHDLRRQIGYMPQTPVLYDDLTARENLLFWGRAHPIADLKKRVAEVLAFIGLTDRQHHPVYTFSGGMKQRLSLGCALVHQPTLLLLDEPTTGVDPKLRETFWSHFRKMTDAGATIILSTHQMDEAVYCDQLAVMRGGQVLACDTPQALLERGHTTVTVWNGTEHHTEQITNYPVELPHLLAHYHLDPTVSRIEVEHEPLEKVVLDLIASQEVNHVQ
ncbi:MAG: ABC transporter ATP-binding protein [Anaerolineaceae bacterium]|nr:ABC transporter ATP-binding protein [Anaerolineaceae bacterium]